MNDTDDNVCCRECVAINRLWPCIEQAKSILQHRPANAETVALALQALDAFKGGD